MDKKYYSLAQVGNTATINIYGNITSWPYLESDVSSHNLSKQLNELENVTQINVFINSYGGEVAEGLAIYNALKRHKAKVITYSDGFACSISSVIYMAGDVRIMYKASLLMIHNAWTLAMGNADALRKQADDLEIITSASIEAYKAVAKIPEKEIKALMDAETWITPQEALEYGFATEIAEEETDKASQSVKSKLFDLLMQTLKQEEIEHEPVNLEPTNLEPDVDLPTESEADQPPPEPDDTKTDDPQDPLELNNEEDATQKLSGFFNALLRL